MDIKSKKSKMVIGLVSWLAGFTIIIVNLSGLCLEMYGYRDFPKHVEEVLGRDYQDTEEFRDYILGCMSDFLEMSVAGTNPDQVGEPGEFLDEWEAAAEPWTEEEMSILEEDYIPSGKTYYNYYGSGFGWDGGYDVVYDWWSMTKAEAEDMHDRIRYNTNILYRIENKGEVLYTNYESLGLDSGQTEEWNYTINTDGGEMNFVMPEGYNYLLYYDGETLQVLKDGAEADVSIHGYGDYWDYDWYIPGYNNVPADDAYRDSRIYMAVAKEPEIIIKKNYDGKGNTYYSNLLYKMKMQSLDKAASYRNWIFSSLLAFVFAALGLTFREYRKEACVSIARVTGKIWYEVKLLPVLAFFFLFLMAGIEALRMFWWQGNSFVYELQGFTIGRGILFTVIFLLIIGFLWLFANDARYNKKPWRISLTAKIIGLFRTSMLKLPFSKRMVRYNIWVFLLGLLSTLLPVTVFAAHRRGTELLIITFILFVCILFLQFLYAENMRRLAVDMDRLVGQIEAVHNGELQENAEISETSGLAEAMEKLNDIRDGMNKAIDRQIKSERMKVELIANVSHDIKTPLTSIISYVELLKQEEGMPEHVKEYVSILESKSQRLKTMVQDVFEVSKAASGELPVHMENLDFCKLIHQTIADMQEQIADSPVSIKCEIPDEAVTIYADGSRLYRVFQNLIQNALKYSLEGSRIYINLKNGEEDAVASVKNTSKEELPSDVDLTERFIRGDKSRTDGGSGLGLSIAQSFTEACGGSFKVETIADLFVVTVSFQSVK